MDWVKNDVLQTLSGNCYKSLCPKRKSFLFYSFPGRNTCFPLSICDCESIHQNPARSLHNRLPVISDAQLFPGLQHVQNPATSRACPHQPEDECFLSRPQKWTLEFGKIRTFQFSADRSQGVETAPGRKTLAAQNR